MSSGTGIFGARFIASPKFIALPDLSDNLISKQVLPKDGKSNGPVKRKAHFLGKSIGAVRVLSIRHPRVQTSKQNLKLWFF